MAGSSSLRTHRRIASYGEELTRLKGRNARNRSKRSKDDAVAYLEHLEFSA